MLRGTASFLLVGGLALIVTWGVRPAESQLPPRPLVMDEGIAPSELDGLRLNTHKIPGPDARPDRLAAPLRDPFHFGTRGRPEPAVEMPSVEVAPPTLDVPDWPSLVALLTKPDSEHIDVALANAQGDLVVTSAGGRFGNFVIADVSSNAVLVVDTVSGASTSLAIR